MNTTARHAMTGARNQQGRHGSRRVRLWDSATAAEFLVIICLGFFVNAVGVALARSETSPTAGTWLYAIGLALIFAGGFLAAAHPRLPSRQRALAVIAMPVALQASRFVLYPTYFAFHDELIHQQVLEDILTTGHLFTPNPLLPVTPFFPGMEIATAGVVHLTGLPDHVAGAVVLLLARTLLASALYALVRLLSRNERAAALALAIYCVGPQTLFFNAQFSYQSLALPLTVAAIYQYANRVHERGPVWAPALTSLAVAITHHVTALFVILMWCAMFAVEAVCPRRRRELRDLALLAVVSALGFGARLFVSGNPILHYWEEIADSSRQDLGLFMEGTATKGVFVNSAGVSSTLLEQGLMVLSVLVTFGALVAATRLAPELLRRRDPAITFLVLLAPLALLGPISHVARATAEVGDRSTGFTYIGVGLLVGLWLAGRPGPNRAVTTTAATALWTATFLGAVVLGAGPLQRQVPGPYEVSADARSVDADSYEAAQWARAHLPAKSRIYSDRVGGLLAGGVGGMHTVRHVSERVDASRMLLAPTLEPADIELIRQADIHYLIVDRRIATGLPNVGVYIESGEYGSDRRTEPVPVAALTKFDSAPGVERIYDNGSVAIYDLRGIR